MNVIKRNNTTQKFERKRIENAIYNAFSKEETILHEDIIKISYEVEKQCYDNIHIEEIQNIVEKELMKKHEEVAKRYIKYREKRREDRLNKSLIDLRMEGIINISKSDESKENANMNAYTPAGQMMQIASVNAKDYALNHLINKEYAALHNEGYIHIHDLDYYASKTTTCVQYDLEELYTNGFYTKNGKITEPMSIETYATLATIVFQTNQNEQHGGQSIPAFDFFMAPGVFKSFKKNLSEVIDTFLKLSSPIKITNIKECVDLYVKSIEKINKQALQRLFNIDLNRAIDIALDKTNKDTYQAMQGFVFNLNTMHSRGGNQVVFSSINYGTDTSFEGRMVISNILKATQSGLGNKEIPIFPIQIFKVKEGINISKADLDKAYRINDWDESFLNQEFESKNFDLFLQSIKTTATSLFPNYVFLDASYNKHEKWNVNDPKRYMYEVATMGCRTRVFENVLGDKTSLGRGNVSFTTINIVRLAIESANKTQDIDKRKVIFEEKVLSMINTVAKQLLERLHYQKSASSFQFPFMSTNDIWKGMHNTNEVGSSITSGTLGIGFIGGHNAMHALFNQSHGDSDEVYEYFYELVAKMNNEIINLKVKYNLNFSLLATPAEGLSGRFTKLDKEKFGVIENVNDRDYYINSFHIDVAKEMSCFDKIRKEAPFHKFTPGGHITYIELDGEAKKNPHALLKIVEFMHTSDIGYGSINHPVDQCNDCNYSGTIYYNCPNCNSNSIKRIRRITGYLTGDLSSWNNAKKSEEMDRVKHL